MKYINKLREEFREYQIFKADFAILDDLFHSSNFFQIVILAPQLLEKIVHEIDESGREFIMRKMGESDKESLEVEKRYNRLKQEETIKARVALYLVDLFENDYCDYSFSKKEFLAYFTKLESIVACRNDLSHEYYKKHISNHKMKIAAKEALDLVELMSLHPALTH